MKVHLIVAHPEPNSFNFALYNQAKTLFGEHDIAIVESDLYSQAFNPVAGKDDTSNFPTNEHYHLAKAQRIALPDNAFSASIKTEQRKLEDCDVLLLQFPLWWWSFPAMLKGWVDRVFTSGFAYGKNATLPPKKVMFSITTGGANSQQEVDYYQQKIDSLYHDVFGFMNWQVLPAFIAHGVTDKSDQQRRAILGSHKAHLLMHLVNVA